MANETILIVDDSPTIQEILKNWLTTKGFVVINASNGLEALSKLEENIPDLIILDIEMPHLSGYDVCREVRKNLRTSNIPVIMLTSRTDMNDKILGLEFGADDYLTKPCDSRELIARIETNIRRSRQEREANPLTGLPGNVQIHDQIDSRIRSNTEFALLYLDLDNFKCFNDVYGFSEGDKVIQRLSEIITDTVRTEGNSNDFVGHIGGDDFICITTLDKVKVLCKDIVQRFDSKIPLHYNEEDRKRGFIYGESREGKKSKCGIMTVSIGAVLNTSTGYKTMWDLVAAGAEAKRNAKRNSESSYYILKPGKVTTEPLRK